MILLLLVFLSSLLVFRTGSEGLLNVGDSLFPFFPDERFQRLLYLWDSRITTGYDNSAAIPQAPWYGLAELLNWLGAPLWVVNRLWFVLPFLLLGFAMHFLSGIVFGEEKKVSRLIATLFFLFNPFTLNLVAGSNILTLSFASGVFVFGLFVRGIGRQTSNFRNSFLLGLFSVLAATSAVIGAMTVLLCIFYLVFFLLVHRDLRSHLRYVLKFLLLSIFCSLLANFWWILPFAYQLFRPGYFSTLFAAGTDVGTLEFMAENTSLFDVSRLFYGINPTYFFPISNYYHYLLAPTVMMVLVVLVFSVALFRKKSKFEIFFLLLAVVSVILASGTRPPFGFVYQFLWDHISYFHIFRTTNRFNLYTMISYAILLGFLYQCVVEIPYSASLQKYLRYFLITLIILSAWPLLSGNVYGQLQPHRIPDDYYQLREFLEEQEGDFRVMSLPRTDWLATYSWSSPFDMQEILVDFSDKDTVVNPVGYLADLEERDLRNDDPLYGVAYYILANANRNPKLDTGEAVGILRSMGVKYLILHHDYVYVYEGDPHVYTQPLEDILAKTEGISFLRSFGGLAVYEVLGFRPRIFATSGKVSYQKVSPVEYRIKVEDSVGRYQIIFGESYNRGWRLNSAAPQGSLSRDFGNVWPVGESGDYEATLTYWPQKLLEMGFLVSVLSLVGGAFVLALKKK